MTGKVAECSSVDLDVNLTCHPCPKDGAGEFVLLCFLYIRAPELFHSQMTEMKHKDKTKDNTAAFWGYLALAHGEFATYAFNK